jgi:hypothetical protein
MRKILMASIVVAIAFCNTANAQYGYVRVAGGASWNNFTNTGQVLAFRPDNTLPLDKKTDPAYSLIVPMLNSNLSDSNNLFIKNLNDGYSRGGILSVFGGYMINPYFGIEIGFTYLFGSNISSETKFDDLLLGKGATLSTRTNSQGLSMMPGFYLRAAKPESKFAPYARLGLSLPLLGSTSHDIIIDGPNGALGYTKSEIAVSTKSTFSIGVNGGIGISYTPIPLITILAEMNGQYLFVRPDVTRLTKYTVTADNNVITDIDKLSEYSKATKFVDEINSSSNSEAFGKSRVPTSGPVNGVDYIAEDKPRETLRQSANFSGIGFSIGIGVNLSKIIFKNPTGKKAAN